MGAYRALVTDINLLGRLDGWEVTRRAREIAPEFPIAYITGADADQWASQGVPDSILVTKPFAPAQLVTAVSQLLNRCAAHVGSASNTTPPIHIFELGNFPVPNVQWVSAAS